MDRARSRQPFLFVANHPSLDFINTEMIIEGHRTDLLEKWPDLIAWLKQAKFLSLNEGEETAAGVDAVEGGKLLTEAKAFRMVLRHMAERIVARKPVPPSAIDAINRLLSQRPGYAQLVRLNERFEQHFHSSVQGSAQLLALLAEAASDLLCTGNLSFVKKCRNHACILYFYDTSKNHARQWCSMSICGNRMKVAAHYRRQRREAKE
jgi:predicted RNA-binding Zn ribbon-like protein